MRLDFTLDLDAVKEVRLFETCDEIVYSRDERAVGGAYTLSLRREADK